MPPSPAMPAPSGDQQRWRAQLESGRAAQARQLSATPTLQMRPPMEQSAAQQGVEEREGGDGGSPRLAAAAGKAASTARTVGKVAGALGGVQGKAVGNALQQGAKALDETQKALQEMSVEGLAREGLYWVKTWILWPAVGINIVFEPLSAFSITFVAMQLYWVVGMSGSKFVKQMPIWEHMVMVGLTIAQMIFFLLAVTSLLLAYCIVSPSCQWDILKNAIIPNVL